MTLKELEKIPHIKSEIIMLRSRLQKLHQKGDFVIDYANDYSTGYKKPITLSGAAVEDDERRKRIIRRIQKLEDMVLDAAKFIDTIPNTNVRVILVARYLDGKSWKEAAKFVYKKMTADAARMSIKRFFNEE